MRATLLSLGVALIGILAYGCASPISNVNATGKWAYRYADDKSGKMELHLQDYKVTGTANDEDGQYTIDGKIDKGAITLDGKSDKGTIKAFGSFMDLRVIEGDYTNIKGVTGKWKATRE